LVSTSLSYRYWNNRIFQPSYFFVVTPIGRLTNMNIHVYVDCYSLLCLYN
jgi:hypothetical protein